MPTAHSVLWVKRSGVIYANVTSTLALLVALGGTGAYAADKIDGKTLKNESVTGKKIKDGSLTGGDLANDVLTSGPAGPRGPAGPAGPSGPAGATPFDIRVVDSVTPGATTVSAGTFGGIPLTAVCRVDNSGHNTADLYGSSPDEHPAVSYAQQMRRINGSLSTSATHVVGPNNSFRLGHFTEDDGGYGATGVFTWKDSAGVRSGIVSVDENLGDNSCQFTGWILHP